MVVIPHVIFVRWDRTSLPQVYGGLGIGAYEQGNNTLLQKWLWRFLQDENHLWKRVISSIYGRNIFGPPPPKRDYKRKALGGNCKDEPRFYAKKDCTVAECWNWEQYDWSLGLRRGLLEREMDSCVVQRRVNGY